jgi:signal transduction histidine kinase
MDITTDGDRSILRLITTSRDKFRTLVDGIEDVVMSIDPDFKIVSANSAMAKRLDRHPREIVGRSCHEMLYGFDRPCGEMGRDCPAERARKSRRLEIALHVLPFDAEGDRIERYIEVRAMPLIAFREGPDDVILVRRDVTAQKKAEIQLQQHSEQLEREVALRTAELTEANRRLESQKDELAETNEELLKLQHLKEDLTNMVVHDLKGPLAEIQANLEMMGIEPVSEMQAEYIESAQLGASDLLRMITNLLDVSRMEENRLILEFEPFDAAQTVGKAVNRFGPLAQLGNVELIAEAPADLPRLNADERLFERILNNLISNALAHTPEGGRVVVAAGYGEGGFRFEVRDNGRGVAPEVHGKIFEKFSQGGGGRPKTGSGLGLTFCRMAVEAHGGRIWVESELDRGSKFIFLIPDQDDEQGGYRSENGRSSVPD